jgi:YHS domain-containing protein
VRAIQLLAWLALVAAIVAPFLRRRPAGPAAGPLPLHDELVKDPVCETYVVRSRAIVGTAGGPPYFCSSQCAQRWARHPHA